MKLSAILFLFQLAVVAQAASNESIQPDIQQQQQPQPAKKDTLFNLIEPRDSKAELPEASKLNKKQYISTPFHKRSANATNSTSSTKNGTNSTGSSSSSDANATWQQSTKSPTSPGSRLWSAYTIHGAVAGVVASLMLA